MTHLTAHSARCALVNELIGVIRDVNALQTLGTDRIGALAALTESAGPMFGSFSDEVRHAWDMARPPTDSDLALIEAERWDCGLIDWGVDEGLDSDEACWAVAS